MLRAQKEGDIARDLLTLLLGLPTGHPLNRWVSISLASHPMKALTLYHPWTSLIVHGFKHYETRSWQTQVRGRIAIHAGRRVLQDAATLCELEPFRSMLSLPWPSSRRPRAYNGTYSHGDNP
jgi:hypothetical protein